MRTKTQTDLLHERKTQTAQSRSTPAKLPPPFDDDRWAEEGCGGLSATTCPDSRPITQRPVRHGNPTTGERYSGSMLGGGHQDYEQ